MINRAPLYLTSVWISAFLSAVGAIASLFAAPADRWPLAFIGTLCLLICMLGLIDGPPPPIDE